MESVFIQSLPIRLDQFLKLAALVESGAQAKEWIQGGAVKRNGEVCLQRGKKLYAGDYIEVEGQRYQVCADASADH